MSSNFVVCSSLVVNNMTTPSSSNRSVSYFLVAAICMACGSSDTTKLSNAPTPDYQQAVEGATLHAWRLVMLATPLFRFAGPRWLVTVLTAEALRRPRHCAIEKS